MSTYRTHFYFNYVVTMSHLNYLAAKRKSVRKYLPDAIDPDVLRDILEAGLRAPSSHNSRSVYFVVVEDRDTLRLLSECRDRVSGFVAQCAVAIVVCVKAEKSTLPYVDAAVAASYIQLAVTDHELGSCWCQVSERRTPEGRDAEAFVREILQIPSGDPVLCILAVGVPRESDLEPRQRVPEWERVCLGAYEEGRLG